MSDDVFGFAHKFNVQFGFNDARWLVVTYYKVFCNICLIINFF